MKTFLVRIQNSASNYLVKFPPLNNFSAHKPINPKTVYMRKLPEHLIPLNTDNGKNNKKNKIISR